MKRIRWRLVLPVLQVGLAIVMLVLADAEEKLFYAELKAESAASAEAEARTRAASDDSVRGGWDLVHVWDYMPAWYLWLLTINFPARVVSSLLAELMGIEKTGGDILMVIAIACFWYWVGRGLDRRLGSLPPPRSTLPTRFSIGLLATAVVLVVALEILIINSLASGSFPLGSLPIGGALLWPPIFALYFAAKLVKKLRAKPA